jgi:uncharacterized membrane protein YqjE
MRERAGEPPPRSVGGAAGNLLHSLSQLGATLVDYGKSQIAQFGHGMEAQVHHAARSLVLAGLIALLCGIGLLMTAITVVVAFWDTPYRLLAAILATVTLFVLAGVAALLLRRHLRRQPSLLRSAAQGALLLSVWKRLSR